MAMLITFLVSALGHELVMGCITKKLRGYGLVAQMLQLPIVALQRTRVIRSRKLLNVRSSCDSKCNDTDNASECIVLDIDDTWTCYGKSISLIWKWCKLTTILS